MTTTSQTPTGQTAIPFNRPGIAGNELQYLRQVVDGGKLSGDGEFNERCARWFENRFKAQNLMLTPSCTAALEMSALLANIEPGDEVILPSFTFPSTANAFVLRGASPRFVEIHEDTLNLDERLLDSAITDRTKAIIPVHYAGVSCEMDEISAIAKANDLVVIEDAAQGVGSYYKGRPLGLLGDMGTYSFHETKNVICGEGGALVINNTSYVERAEIIREKGTDRSKFYRGEVDKYTWVDVGSSYLISELNAAFLYAQLEQMDAINGYRCEIYARYRDELQVLADEGKIRLPYCPTHCRHNAHMFYILVADQGERDELVAFLKEAGIAAAFHYNPLHCSPMGKNFGYREGQMPITETTFAQLLRLPMFPSLSSDEQARVIGRVKAFYGQ